MRVGITTLPATSTTSAPGPARALISAEVPTATIVPPAIAMASVTVLRPSTVMTVPPIKAKSTRGWAVAALAAARTKAAWSARVSTVSRSTLQLLAETRPRPHFDLAGRVPELAELDAHTGRDGARLLLILEAREVRPLAPRKRAAKANSCVDCGVVDDVDQPLIVG